MPDRFVVSGNGAESDAETVPSIDRHHGERQLRQFVVGELLPRLFAHLKDALNTHLVQHLVKQFALVHRHDLVVPALHDEKGS